MASVCSVECSRGVVASCLTTTLVIVLITIYLEYESMNFLITPPSSYKIYVPFNESNVSVRETVRNSHPADITRRLAANTGNAVKLPMNKSVKKEPAPPAEPQCYKQVHIWSNEHRITGKFPCPGLRCGILQVEDTSFDTLKRSDAVLLMHRTGWDWREMHEHRPPGQKWIFYSQESQINTRSDVIPPPEYYYNSYDYIMTFRPRESVLYGSYGKYDTSRPTVARNDSRNWAAGKTKLAVWMASNCQSHWLHWKRTEFVQELAKLVQVDMYGKCGEQSACPRGQNAEACQHKLRTHKFYLSLENCACRDYFTEKFWNNAYLLDMIPVVFGPPRSDYEAAAPPNSFIHVRDFASLKELADYLTLLDNDDTLYNKYFEWKKLGFVTVTREDWLLQPQQMCQVVNQLLADEYAVAKGTYKRPKLPDWRQWWGNSCEHIRDFPIKMS